MANPQERDDLFGTAASADAESYRGRRQGNLTRASDGFRAPTLPPEPRRPLWGPYAPDPPNAPYHYNPASPASGAAFAVPRTFVFLRTASPGAPRVGFPDARRTQGKLQQSGAAWGHVGESVRPRLAAPTDGVDAPPLHRNEPRPNSELIPRSVGPRWARPSVPTIRDQWLNH